MNYKEKVDEIVKNFWQNLNDMLELLEEIIETCYQDNVTQIKPFYITVLRNVLNNCLYQMEEAPKDVNEYRALFLQKFAAKTYPNWDKINQRDEEYFANNFVEMFINGKENKKQSSTKIDESNILSILSTYAEDFHKLFINDEYISMDDRSDLWRFIIRLVQQACEFVYWNRNPNLETGKFRIKFLPEINHLNDWVSRWNLI